VSFPRATVAGLAIALLAGARCAPPPPPPPAPGPAVPFEPPLRNELGVNIGGTLDVDGLRLYADVMRTSHEPERPAGGLAAVDEDGWPLEDFTVLVWRGVPRMQGSYALSFEGRASRVEVIGGDATLSDLSFDAASNRTSGRLAVREPGRGDLTLRFTGTRRTPSSTAGSGLRRLSLLRPVSPGAATSEPSTALFSAPAVGYLGRFQVVRFMDYLATNDNQQRDWAERPRPAWGSFRRLCHQRGYGWQGIGGPWEHVVLLANLAGVDPWITLPGEASDDYVRKVALLFRNGSDGVEPYPAPVAHPVFPPLDSARRLYVEYANEVWNGDFKGQALPNRARARAEVAAGGSLLDFDKIGTGGPLAWLLPRRAERGPRAWAVRRIAERGMQISALFREVFGDEQMMVRVRPMLMTQAGDGQETLSEATRLLLGAAAGLEGDFGVAPQPPGYHFFGAGGSGYYNPDPEEEVTLETFWRSGTMDPRRWEGDLARDADLVAALGLHRACYEGGPSLDLTGHGDGAKAAAVGDRRMTAALLEHHQAWSAHGGELFVYYQAVGDHRWGLTDDIHRLGTPKLEAIEALRDAARAPLAHGLTLPARIEAGRFSVSPLRGDRPGPGGRTLRAGTGGEAWVSYTLRSPRASRARITVVTGEGAPGRLSVLWDGRPVGVREVPAAGGELAFGEVEAGPGLHGRVVSAARGAVRVEALRVE
jgi:hypothetical protein